MWTSRRKRSAYKIDSAGDAIATEFSSRTHIVPVDGVRGLAILAVVLYHGTPGVVNASGVVLRAVGAVLQMGWLGVDLFFVLSGFLITGILLDTTSDPHYFRSFYVRRALRILPMYYGVLLLLGVLTLPLGIQWHGTVPYFVLYLQNYDAYDHLTLKSRYVQIHLEHLWSLAIEEQFYLVWPFFVWLLRRRDYFFVVPLALVIACPVGRWLYFHPGSLLAPAYLWTPFRADALAWGAIAAWLVRQRAHWVKRASILLMTSGFAVVVAVMLDSARRPDRYELMFTRFGYSAVGALFCGLILGTLVPGSMPERVFRNRGLRWLGKYSYGIYILHYLFVSSYLRVQLYVKDVSGSKTLGALAYLLCTVLVGTLAAYASYNLYEKWWLRLKDGIAGYTVQRGAQAS
ncbi:MAG TPA: acyltransferase [Acidobacteriaceae bacterium]|jgi:peptidoglycan/LPS O-acetylase OafA/YrhL